MKLATFQVFYQHIPSALWEGALSHPTLPNVFSAVLPSLAQAPQGTAIRVWELGPVTSGCLLGDFSALGFLF